MPIYKEILTDVRTQIILGARFSDVFSSLSFEEMYYDITSSPMETRLMDLGCAS